MNPMSRMRKALHERALQVALTTLDEAGALSRELCQKYGGLVYMPDTDTYFVRLCSGWRHHTDSHAYDSFQPCGNTAYVGTLDKNGNMTIAVDKWDPTKLRWESLH